MNKQIKVLIFDDYNIFRGIIEARLKKNKHIEFLGNTTTVNDTLLKIKELKPDVLVVDLSKTALSDIPREIKSLGIKTIFAVNEDEYKNTSPNFIKKPKLTGNVKSFVDELESKILHTRKPQLKKSNLNLPHRSLSNSEKKEHAEKIKTNIDIIAIGASTGGTDAIFDVICHLPSGLPPIVIVQHMPSGGFTAMFAKRLDAKANLTILEASDGMRLSHSTVYVAPGDKHMAVIKSGSNYLISLYDGEKVSSHRPSVDVLFNSVSKLFKKNAIGVILTGMGQDGARGLLAMKNQGSYTIGQNKETCTVYGMPMSAQKLGAVSIELPLKDIGNHILKSL